MVHFQPSWCGNIHFGHKDQIWCGLDANTCTYEEPNADEREKDLGFPNQSTL